MSDLIFCGNCLAAYTSEPLTDRGWSERQLLWHLSAGVPQIALEALAAIFDRACKSWTQHCQLELSRTTNAAQALIRATVATIDGPRGILAQSNLPPTRPCRQQYDRAEDWGGDINPLAVIAHELGHALGLQHDPQPGALMSAYYDPQILEPAERDVRRIVALYGKRVVEPPHPEDDVAATMVILGQSGHEKARYKLTWIAPPT